MTIGNECTLKLKEVMEMKGISQRRLSILSGVSRTYIHNLINGDYSNPGILVISRLCIGLQCSFDELVEINPNMSMEQQVTRYGCLWI